MVEENILINIEQSNEKGQFACEGAKVWQCTRAEAIEEMAKAKHKYEKELNPDMCDWDDYKERAKDEYYRKPAEYMLNALLGE